jgi:predicted amidohydrolase
MIVDPWGTVLFNAEKKLGLFGAALDKERLDNVRQSMPIKQHNKFVSRNIKSSY